MIKLNRLNEKLRQLEIINEALTEIVIELHQDLPHGITPPRTMHRRRVPLLGFIGSILGPVIGVITSDDAGEYNEAINDIYEIHTKMEDYEFPIPTSHIRVELLSQIGKTDLKITSGKLLISVEIPLLGRKALKLYKIYPFPVYQNISGNYTRAIYISPRKQYIALTEDERKFFLTDKDYCDTCQKTIYHTICESTQPIHQIVTTTSCECLMLTRPSMKTLQKGDVRINTKNSVF